MRAPGLRGTGRQRLYGGRTSLEESSEGPARKYYELTRRGEQLLGDMNSYWDKLTRGVSDLKRGAK